MKQIKQNPEVKNKIKEGILILKGENLATKEHALVKAYSQQIALSAGIEVVKEVLLEQQDEIEILECEVVELKKIIGNDEISTKAINKAFENVHNKPRSEKEQKMLDRLVKKSNEMKSIMR